MDASQAKAMIDAAKTATAAVLALHEPLHAAIAAKRQAKFAPKVTHEQETESPER